MTQEQYIAWCDSENSERRAIFLRSRVDPIVIAGIPTGRRNDRLIEGFVVQSETAHFPVMYVSLAWWGENFEPIPGHVDFIAAGHDPVAKAAYAAKAPHVHHWREIGHALRVENAEQFDDPAIAALRILTKVKDDLEKRDARIAALEREVEVCKRVVTQQRQIEKNLPPV